jgi:hypothetical protein
VSDATHTFLRTLHPCLACHGSGVSADRAATVRRLTREQMLNERAELLAGIAMTEDELRAAGEAWELDSHHRGVLSRINGLDFLLSHTPR